MARKLSTKGCLRVPVMICISNRARPLPGAERREADRPRHGHFVAGMVTAEPLKPLV
jgi:hypothetical protein